MKTHDYSLAALSAALSFYASISVAEVRLGNGAPCTEKAFRDAVAAEAKPIGRANTYNPTQGKITFLCGKVVIPITTPIEIPEGSNLIIAGNGITLDGDKKNRVITTGKFVKLRLENLTIANGYTLEQGAGVKMGWRSLTEIHKVTFKNNRAMDDSDSCLGGGALYIDAGLVTITRSQFIDNFARNGGAIKFIYANATIEDTTFTNNRAEHSQKLDTVVALSSPRKHCGGGGAIYYDAGRKKENEDGKSETNTEGFFRIKRTTFKGNTTNHLAGALFTFLYNDTSRAKPADVVELTDVLFDGNKSEKTTWTVDGKSLGGSGGAVWNGGNLKTMMHINNTLFVNNQASTSGGALYGIAPFKVTNSTFYKNQAYDPEMQTTDWKRGLGGAIYVNTASTGELVHTTIVDNRAGFAGGAVTAKENSVTVKNSIIANNKGESAYNYQINCSTTLVNGGNNVQFPAKGTNKSDLECFSNLTPQDAKMDTALRTRGGYTKVLQPLAGSPALNKGQGCASTDQRGAPRPTSGCDIGAVELNSAALPVPVPTPVLGGSATTLNYKVENAAQDGQSVVISTNATSKVSTTIAPDPAHKNQTATLIIGAQYIPPNSTTRNTGLWFIRDATGNWQSLPYEQILASLGQINSGSVVLSDNVDVPIIAADFSPFTGAGFQVYFGYRLPNGTAVFAEDPLDLKVE